METQRHNSSEPERLSAPTSDGVIGDTTTFAARPTAAYGAATQTGENVMTVRDRVQWGPIVAGLVAAIATMLLLTVLGIAVGASVLDRTAAGEEIGTWAAVWGAVSAIVAFFVGGWLAARTAAVGGPFAGLVNGFTVGAAGLVLILWLTGAGVGNLFGTIGADIGAIAGVAPDQPPAQADEAAAAAEQTARGSFDEIRNAAFGAFLGLLLPLVAAALGGYLGHHKRRELIEGTG